MQSPTEKFREIAIPGIKDDSTPLLHLINGADLCRQPLAEWLKPSLNMVCRDHGNKVVQMESESRRRPAAWIPSSFPSTAFQHAAATCQQSGNYASSDIVNKDLWYLAGVYCSGVICHRYNHKEIFITPRKTLAEPGSGSDSREQQLVCWWGYLMPIIYIYTCLIYAKIIICVKNWQ